MNERLYLSTQTSSIAEPIEELSGVVLTKDLEAAEGRLSAGAQGTIVLVHGAGKAYLVEFEDAFHALVKVDRGGLEPIAGESRADLAAAVTSRRNA